MSIVLNQQQEIIKNQAVHWFNFESSAVFEIDGPAGTGKSVLIKAILDALHLKQTEYYAMAYTGQASIVMRTRGFSTARSIHSTLYEVVEVESANDLLAEKFGVKSKRTEFRLRKFIDPNIKLFFIDEGYMVPDFMVKDILSFGIKVIVAGDAHQLPPIGGAPGFLTGEGVHHLSQLMRQASDSPIVYIANRAMKGEPIHCGMYGNDVLVCTDDEFVPQMIGYIECVLCGTNRTRTLMNNYIRSLAGFNGTIPHFGERIICRKNNWDLSIDGIALANGLSGTIVNNPDASGFDGKSFLVDFKPDLINDVFYKVPVNYKYFTAPLEEKNELRNSFESKWLTGELFDFSYALTTHLAQGSEYNSCLFIEEFMNPQIMNQLIYTGVTRAKKKLIYIRKKHKNFYIPGINQQI